MALAQYYVDPGSGNDTTGDGLSVGTAWATIQKVFDTATQDAQGDQINVVIGTDDVLAAPLDVTGWVTTDTKPLVFRGCNASGVNDGSHGGIDGNGTRIFDSLILDYIEVIDMHCHNCGSDDILKGDDYWSIINCEINNTSGDGLNLDDHAFIAGNNIHDCSGAGIRAAGKAKIASNYLKNGTKSFSAAIAIANDMYVAGNYISVSGATDGIAASSVRHMIEGNSILCSGGTGTGILPSSTSGFKTSEVFNNIVEGFSGTGGAGFDFLTHAAPARVFANNAAYNNTVDYQGIGEAGDVFSGGNEVLGSSAFAKVGSDTFANREEYFKLLDVGNVLNGGIF